MYSSSSYIWNIEYFISFWGEGAICILIFLNFKLFGKNQTTINCIIGQRFKLIYQEYLI